MHSSQQRQSKLRMAFWHRLHSCTAFPDLRCLSGCSCGQVGLVLAVFSFTHPIISYYYMTNNNGQVAQSFQEVFRKKIQNYSYSLQDRLGSGYSSQVFRGKDDRNHGPVAVKVVSLAKVRSKGLEEMLNREIRLLKDIKHQNIISCLDVLMTANNCYIVTQFCPQGDLASILAKKGRLPDDEALKLIHQICQGLVFLHAHGIMHRDIKPQNILVNGRTIKIADFGFAVRSEQPTKERYTIGSPLYMSPEALNHREYSTKNDIWALGVTMYEILEGRVPWSAHNQKELRETIKGELRFRNVKSAELQELIRGCMQYDVNQRLSALEVQVKLESVMGIRSCVSWSVRQNKENSQRGNCEPPEDQEMKKAMRNNYNFLKWLINYSRFSAKLLPRLQDHLDCQASVKQPFVEMAARLLHLTISKLNRVEEVHHQLALTHFDRFKRTTRFAKIQAVTAQYHQRYLLLLTRLPYKYHHPSTLTIDFPQHYFQNLQKLKISDDCSQQHLTAIDFLLTLSQVAFDSKNITPHSMAQLVDFQRLVENPPSFSAGKVGELLQRRESIAKLPLIKQ